MEQPVCLLHIAAEDAVGQFVRRGARVVAAHGLHILEADPLVAEAIECQLLRLALDETARGAGERHEAGERVRADAQIVLARICSTIWAISPGSAS